MGEHKAREERAHDNIQIDWTAIPLTISRSERPQMLWDPVPEGETTGVLVKVRAVKLTIRRYVECANEGRMSQRDGRLYWGPLQEDLDDDALTAMLTRRVLEWAVKFLKDEELKVPMSCSVWAPMIVDYITARLAEDVPSEDIT
jgi:hypothetical protein